MSRLGAVALLLLVVAGLAARAARPASASAHPLGNFTVNTYSRLELYADAIRVRYVLDMAEVPAFQERQRIDVNSDDRVDAAEVDAYLGATVPALVADLSLTLDGQPVALEAVAPALEFPEGAGGLSTLRLTLWISATVPEGEAPHAVHYEDRNYRDRLGWRELIVEPLDSTLRGAVPTDDPTDELRNYPADRLQSPRVTRSLDFAYSPGATRAPGITAAPSAAAAPASKVVGAPEAGARGGFEGLIAPERLTLPLAVVALLGAAAFGALHALEPGHGKTLVAAYFVGTRGTAPQAFLLGLIVAATHTVGVFVIGLATLVGAKYVLPEDLYPWLSTVSGLVLAAIGLTLLRPRLLALLRRDAPVSDGEHPHEHHHHHHGPGSHTHVPAGGSSDDAPPWRGLVALGLADGLVPTPSTLVVLLAAVSLGRIGFGLALIASFSLGFGAVLTTLALVFVYARRWFSRITVEGGPLRLASGVALQRGLPVVAALVLVGVGLTLSARSLSAIV